MVALQAPFESTGVLLYLFPLTTKVVGKYGMIFKDKSSGFAEVLRVLIPAVFGI